MLHWNSKLDQNSFEKFPAELGAWTELKTLNLAHNSIEDVKLNEDQPFAAMQDLFVSFFFPPSILLLLNCYICIMLLLLLFLNSDVSYNRLVCEAVEETFSGSRIVTCSDFSENEGSSSSSTSSGGKSSGVSNSSEKSGLAWWGILLIVLGALALVAVLVILIVVFLGKKKSTTYEPINGSR